MYVYTNMCVDRKKTNKPNMLHHGPWIVSGIISSSCIFPSWSHEKNLITLPSSNLAPLANNKTLGNQHPGSKLAVSCLFRVLRIGWGWTPLPFWDFHSQTEQLPSNSPETMPSAKILHVEVALFKLLSFPWIYIYTYANMFSLLSTFLIIPIQIKIYILQLFNSHITT